MTDMPQWKGIVGKAFTADQFDQYVDTLTFNQWKPQFVVVHNTEVPSFASWHRVPGADRMRALERYYRDEKGWSGGPHLFIADDLIWAFTPLWLPGVHAPSWNAIAWGAEIVGNYETEPLTLPVLSNAVAALTSLHRIAGLDPATIRFHKEDPKTDHDKCPGKNVRKDVLIDSVRAQLGGTASPIAPAPVARTRPVLQRGSSNKVAVAELQALLGMHPGSPGTFGPLTEAAVKEYQSSHGLTADGIVGRATWLALTGG